MDTMINVGMAQNPFQILTFIVAPAILTNSSSVLSLSTSNRFARTVDRARVLYEKLKKPDTLTPQEKAMYAMQLQLIGQRAQLLVKALTFFYFSVGTFAATAFASLLGAGIAYLHSPLASEMAIGFALFTGVGGVLGLVCGTGLLVREMWLAMSFLKAEVRLTESLLVHEASSV